MSNKCSETETAVRELKNEAARKRWELFHAAIGHAKKYNVMAMQEADSTPAESKNASPFLSVAR